MRQEIGNELKKDIDQDKYKTSINNILQTYINSQKVINEISIFWTNVSILQSSFIK